MSTRVQLQPSYLLHRRPFRDSSQLLEVFSLDHGRLSLVARGVSRRRRGGSLASILQPFRPLLLSFSGRGELATLTGAEAAGELAAPTGERLYSALYLNELLMRLLHRHEAHAALFSAYGRALEELAGAPAAAAVLRRFELSLLDELGYGVDLACDTSGDRALDPTLHYRVDPEQGVSPVLEVNDGDGETFNGDDLLAIGRGQVDGERAAAARRLTRILLQPYIGARPLNARMFYTTSAAARQSLHK